MIPWHHDRGGIITELILCVLAVFIGVIHLVISHFRQKKWFAFLPMASYLCLVPFVMNTFHDVARRAQTGDIGGLLDIYPGIGNGFLMLVGVITVLHGIALLRSSERSKERSRPFPTGDKEKHDETTF